MDVQVIVSLGREMGLEGDALRDFVKETINEERNERSARRSHEKEIAEIKSRHDKDIEEMKFREREQERAHQLELKKLESQNLLHESIGEGNLNSTIINAVAKKGPKLPYFEDEKDDMDSYISRFERYAIAQGWKDEEYALYLSSLLRGKALDVYTRLPIDDASDYKKVKAALLKHYLLTEDGYRVKFHTSRMEKGETASQFMARIGKYFDRWLEMAEVSQDYGELREFVIVEKFLHLVPQEVRVHIREHKTHIMEQVIEKAECFMDAHNIGNVNNAKRDKNKSKLKDSKNESAKPHKQENASNPQTGTKPKITCFLCGKLGHKAMDCRVKNKVNANVAYIPNTDPEQIHPNEVLAEATGTATCVIVSSEHRCNRNTSSIKSDRIPSISSSCLLSEDKLVFNGLPIQKGIVNGKQVSVLRDTGCSGVIIRRDLVNEKQLTGQTQMYISVDRTMRTAPVCEIYIDTPFYCGIVKALCLENPLCDVILDNVKAVVSQPGDFMHKTKQVVETAQTNCMKLKNETIRVAVQTRSQTKHGNETKTQKPLKIPQLPNIDSAEAFQKEQLGDLTLTKIWQKVETGEITRRKSMRIKFVKHQGLVYRQILDKHDDTELREKQLVVPKKYRDTVLKTGHDALLAGHMGMNKTIDRIQNSFFWPGMNGDIVRYCKSCDICQRTSPKGRVKKVPMENVPTVSVPFDRVAVDIVGPINPRSKRGNKYILTMVDLATRYPKAVALPNIETTTIAEELFNFFCDLGIPREVLSDNGTQFTAEMMQHVQELLSIKSVKTSPYHAQTNGACEKYNGTLKTMITRLASDHPQDWDRYLQPLLFAYREAPIKSLGGFSPFELLRGSTVRGPMCILKELWSNNQVQEDVKTVYQYVIDLRERMENTIDIVRKEITKSKDKAKIYYDKHAADRKLDVGDHALILLPTDHNKLLMRWKGPFEVTKRVRLNDYILDVNGTRRMYHINMLKKYNRRSDCEDAIQASTAVIFEEDDICIKDEPDMNQCFDTKGGETYKNVNINPNLNENQKREIQDLIYEYRDIFSSKPGCTNLTEHKVTLTDTEPIRLKSYPIPYNMYDQLRKEIDEMLRLGIIEPSDSPYNCPLIMIKKKDGSYRTCADMRAVNKVTLFDCEPNCDPNKIFSKLAGDKYFTKIDFCKGYWQIKVKPEHRHITAFSTPFGHFQYRMMPFGMVNSGATYNRMMRKLLSNMSNIDNFVDDVLGHTKEWFEHLKMLRSLFDRISQANLTIKPSKCFTGYNDIDFVGHRIKDGNILPQDDKTEKIRDAKIPKTKKELRSFIGLCSYYRVFSPNFADKILTLTELTKKSTPNKLPWTDEHTLVFEQVKHELCNHPILKLPDCDKAFVLRTDASDTGLGAVLLQRHDDTLFPVAYISKKLLPRERNFATVERECLAVVWAVQRFQVYLYGREFILQTDHGSLSYLHGAKFNNPRLMRWALILQPYRYRVEVIKGSDNIGADYLSRQDN